MLCNFQVTDRITWRDSVENGGYRQLCEDVTWALKTDEHRLKEKEREDAK